MRGRTGTGCLRRRLQRLHDKANLRESTSYHTCGTNSNQVQAIVDNVEEQLGRAGFEAKQIEGNRNSSWILMDYGDVIVHVFDEENRLFYDLERIWRDGKVLEMDEFLEK